MHFKTSNYFQLLMKSWWKLLSLPEFAKKSKEEALPKLSRVEILLNHYGTYMAHIESLAKKIH